MVGAHTLQVIFVNHVETLDQFPPMSTSNLNVDFGSIFQQMNELNQVDLMVGAGYM